MLENSLMPDQPASHPADFPRIIKLTLLSAGLSGAISAIEYLLYLYTGSLALKADAFHTGSDVLAILLVLVNSLLVKGRNRWIERLSGLFISVLIFLAAGNVILESRRMETGEPRSLWVAMIAVITALVLTYTLSQYKIKVGREEDFPLLVSEGRHSYMDALSSIVVLIGLVGQEIGIRLDAPAAIIVAVLVGATGWTVLREHAFNGVRTFNFWNRSGLTAQIRAAAAIGLAVYLLSGFYTVGEGRVVLVQRWGRLIRTTEPGRHYRLPWPFEKTTRHDCALVQRLDIGAVPDPPPENAPQSGENSETELSDPAAASSEKQPSKAAESVDPTDRFVYGDTLEMTADAARPQTAVDAPDRNRDLREAIRFTGDQNLIEIHLSVYYRVSDPAAFQFNVDDARILLKGLCESAAMETLSRHSLDDALGGDRARLLDEMKTTINREARALGLGIDVLWLSCLGLKPSPEVMPAFRMVSSAQEDRERYINQAHTRARMAARQGQARMLEILGAAKAYAIDEKVKAEAESHRLFFLFNHMEYNLDEYINIMYLETLEEILKDRPKLFLPPREAPIYLDLRQENRPKGMP